MSEVSFDKLQHLITVPVSVNGVESRFVLDSGIGLTLLRSELAESMEPGPRVRRSRVDACQANR